MQSEDARADGPPLTGDPAPMVIRADGPPLTAAPAPMVMSRPSELQLAQIQHGFARLLDFHSEQQRSLRQFMDFQLHLAGAAGVP